MKNLVIAGALVLGAAALVVTYLVSGAPAGKEPVHAQDEVADQGASPPRDAGSELVDANGGRETIPREQTVDTPPTDIEEPIQDSDPFEEEMRRKYGDQSRKQLSTTYERLKAELEEEKFAELSKRHESGLYDDECPMAKLAEMDWNSHPEGTLASGTTFLELPSGPVIRLTRLPANEYPELASRVRELEWIEAALWD